MTDKTILVADDETHILAVVSLKLRNAGFTVLTARDDLVLERAVDRTTFEVAEGPFDQYRRSVGVRELGSGRHEVTETVDWFIQIQTD